MKRIRLLLASIATLGVLFVPAIALAQSTIDPVCNSVTGQTKPAVCSSQNNVEVVGSNGVIVKIARMVGIVTGVACVIVVMMGGFKYIISRGDPGEVNNSKNTILYAMVGLAISVAAPFILGFVLSQIN